MPRKVSVNKRKKATKKNIKRNRNSYSLKQKKEIVEYAKQHGRNKAAAHFELDATMVGRWIKASSGWTTEMNQDTKRIGSGRKAFYPEAEKKLYDWIIEQRKQGLAVTYAIIRVKMLNILKEDNNVLVENFKMSNH